MTEQRCDVAIIGSGIVGIASACYLKQLQPELSVALIDAASPMSCTSAVSGENYRNWWPHPVMTAFTDHSINLLETHAIAAGDRVRLTRRGYALATRSRDVDVLLAELEAGYGDSVDLRLHDTAEARTYRSFHSPDWRDAPAGVDVLTSTEHIRRCFPSFSKEIHGVVHVRRAGAFDSYQLGQYLLEQFRALGGVRVNARVVGIDASNGFLCELADANDIHCEQLVNAAGPWIADIANMLGAELPVFNVLQQKIAFADTRKVIPRDMPFAIDLDAGPLSFSDEERALLLEDSASEAFGGDMPGATHCRPEGGDNGDLLKLGWAYNDAPESVTEPVRLREEFTDVVLRGAARLHPGLHTYVDNPPEPVRHYGGYYTMTEENWPLIGAMHIEGAYVVGALSGFGTMAACAAGELCAQYVTGASLPSWAAALSPQRHANAALMNELLTQASRGIL